MGKLPRPRNEVGALQLRLWRRDNLAAAVRRRSLREHTKAVDVKLLRGRPSPKTGASSTQCLLCLACCSVRNPDSPPSPIQPLVAVVAAVTFLHLSPTDPTGALLLRCCSVI
ncbi:hypothetical protein HPP92_001340 [Vanilla planifolia]|uniref:Uncharacterized protein n=1 Tax=Vanilla planifolia TaxID=51239 RepID=A0A835S2B8_VANPL|nr:hypothetical protein HPP92_001340 [Vanilla planifolia]